MSWRVWEHTILIVRFMHIRFESKLALLSARLFAYLLSCGLLELGSLHESCSYPPRSTKSMPPCPPPSLCTF